MPAAVAAALLACRSMNVEDVIADLRVRLIALLSSRDRVEIDAVIDEFDLDEDLAGEVTEELIDRSESLIYFEIFFDASPMSNNVSTGIDLLDLGGDIVLLASPADPGIDVPGIAWATVSRGDRERAFELVGRIVVKTRLENELPAGGGLSDRVHVPKDFPSEILQVAFAEIFAARPLDIDEARAVIKRAGGDASDADRLADRYLEAVVRRDL